MFVRKNGLVWNSAWNFGTPKCDGFIRSKPQNSLHFSGYTTFTTFQTEKTAKLIEKVGIQSSGPGIGYDIHRLEVPPLVIW